MPEQEKLLPSILNIHQKEFDEKYVTVAELSETFGISVFTLSGMRVRGLLPNAISVANLYIYRRGELDSILNAYIKMRTAKNEFESKVQ